MENIRIVWWFVVIILVCTTMGCASQDIQPNPLYRIVNRRVSASRMITRQRGAISSTVGLLTGLFVGGIVYWMCICMCCPKTPLLGGEV